MKRLLFVLVACGHTAYPPPAVQRTCTEPQTREALDCREYDFQVRLSHDADYTHPRDEVALFHNGSRTECGCIRNLAAAVDAAAQNEVRSEVLSECRCTQQRN